jgi:hypothetical protein
MASLSLVFSTGNLTIDRLVMGLVSIFEHVFPNRVSGYYLLGSYANGSALPSSDLDMVMLFKDRFLSQHEFDTAVAINESCKLISPVVLDAWVISDEHTRHAAFIGDTLELKSGGRLIYGVDTRHTITVQPDINYVRWAMDIPAYPITVARNVQGIVTVPVDYPDPAGRFFGYDQWLLDLADGRQVPGMKLLVATVGRIASALLAYTSGRFVGSKRECVEHYRRYIDDQWTDLVVQVYEQCRNQWGYRIPERNQEQEQLRELCRRTLGFENHFLALYKAHLLALLHDPDPAVQLHAVERLGRIIYRDPAVNAALSRLEAHADETLRQAIATTQHQMRVVLT